jgi:oligopeptide transport system substrate-binding protein
MRWLTAFSVLLVFLLNTDAPAQIRSNTVDHLGFNVTAAPLDVLLLRQAITSAIERRALYEATKARLPAATPASGPAGGWFPPSLPQHDPEVRSHPYDVAVAKSLLGQAGFPEGQGLTELEVLYNQGAPVGAFRAAEGAMIRAQLASIGIRVKLPGQGRQGQFQAFLLGRVVLPNDDFLSRTFLPGGPTNAFGYRSPEVAVLIASALKETDVTKRIAMLREAERLVLSDAPVVPLMYLYAP